MASVRESQDASQEREKSMPIYDVECPECGFAGEVITLGQAETLRCPSCNGIAAQRQLSPTSSLTGKAATAMPGPRDTGCCGSSPAASGCAGPGSCCGKAFA